MNTLKKVANNLILTVVVLVVFYVWLALGSFIALNLKMNSSLSLVFLEVWMVALFLATDSRVQKFKVF
jgi:hypothetical protein